MLLWREQVGKANLKKTNLQGGFSFKKWTAVVTKSLLILSKVYAVISLLPVLQPQCYTSQMKLEVQHQVRLKGVSKLYLIKHNRTSERFSTTIFAEIKKGFSV